MKVKILLVFLLLVLISTTGCVSILSRGGSRGFKKYPVYPGVSNVLVGSYEILQDKDPNSRILFIAITPILLVELSFDIALDSLLIHVDFFRWLLKPRMVPVSDEDDEETESQS